MSGVPGGRAEKRTLPSCATSVADSRNWAALGTNFTSEWMRLNANKREDGGTWCGVGGVHLIATLNGTGVTLSRRNRGGSGEDGQRDGNEESKFREHC